MTSASRSPRMWSGLRTRGCARPPWPQRSLRSRAASAEQDASRRTGVREVRQAGAIPVGGHPEPRCRDHGRSHDSMGEGHGRPWAEHLRAGYRDGCIAIATVTVGRHRVHGSRNGHFMPVVGHGPVSDRHHCPEHERQGDKEGTKGPEQRHRSDIVSDWRLDNSHHRAASAGLVIVRLNNSVMAANSGNVLIMAQTSGIGRMYPGLGRSSACLIMQTHDRYQSAKPVAGVRGDTQASGIR
jgi:hypothetical protein